MASLRDIDIQKYLMDEGIDDDAVEPEDDCVSDNVSCHSDCPSEQEAEDVEVQPDSRKRRRQENLRTAAVHEDSSQIQITQDTEELQPTTDSVSQHRNNSSNFVAKDGITWAKEPVRRQTRTTHENIIMDQPGVKTPYKEKKTLMECFELFICEDILTAVYLHTNEKIRYTNILSSKIEKSDPTTSETSIAELKALFGLLFLAGLNRSGRQNTNDLWNQDGTGIEIFRMTMSRNRFVFLLNNLRFDDMLSRTERSSVDRLAPIREIFEYFVRNCNKIYSPTENLTLDEELVAFRGRCGFRQYIPSKPAKYGIKIYALVDSKTFYTQHLEVYCGKQPQNSPYEVSNKAFDVVNRMVSPVSGSSRNITMDNFFTSYETAKNLLENKKLTVVGTLRANKTCIPQDFKARREENTSLFGFQKDVTLVSYVPKPRKMVYLLSTLHHDAQIDNETGDQQKPEIITFYNKTKSGVDVVDKLARTFDVSRNSKRWPLTIFFSLLNHAGINAMIVYLLNNEIDKNKTDTRRNFIRQLGLSLIADHLTERKNNVRLSKDLRSRLHQHFGESSNEIPKPTKDQGKKVRCTFCPRNKDRKTKNRCQKCKVPICMDHCNFICGQCENDESD